jgi:hypothetical protein
MTMMPRAIPESWSARTDRYSFEDPYRSSTLPGTSCHAPGKHSRCAGAASPGWPRSATAPTN